MGVILGIIVLQCAIAAVVVFVLLRLLDRELVEAALEMLGSSAFTPALGPVTVTSAGVLDAQVRERLGSLVRRKAEGAQVAFKEAPEVKGGVIIDFAGGSIDFSLASRLKEFWAS